MFRRYLFGYRRLSLAFENAQSVRQCRALQRGGIDRVHLHICRTKEANVAGFSNGKCDCVLLTNRRMSTGSVTLVATNECAAFFVILDARTTSDGCSFSGAL